METDYAEHFGLNRPVESGDFRFFFFFNYLEYSVMCQFFSVNLIVYKRLFHSLIPTVG